MLKFALGNSATTTDCQVKVTFLKKKSWTEKHTFVYVLLSVYRLVDKLLSIIKELHLKKCFCCKSYFSVNNFKSKKYKYNKKFRDSDTVHYSSALCLYSIQLHEKNHNQFRGGKRICLLLILNGDII